MEIVHFFFIFVAIELFESNWQKSSTLFPSLTFNEIFGSKEYLIISLSSVVKITVGLYPLGIYSLITSFDVPVNSSNCSETVTPGITSSNEITPAFSAIVGFA